jgi:hypothetical protein
LQLNVHRYATHRIGRCVALTVLLCALTVRSAALRAQAPANRFFGSIGAGVGKSGPANSTGNDQYSGVAGDAALGMSLTSRGLIGLHLSGWRNDTPIGSSRSAFVTLTLYGYPFGTPLSNLFFAGGLGVGNGSFPVHTTTSVITRLNVTRPALLVGLGYDIPVACPLWITPFFQSYGTIGGRRFTQTPSPGENLSANAILFHIGLSLKFLHPGPPGQCRQRGAALTQ